MGQNKEVKIMEKYKIEDFDNDEVVIGRSFRELVIECSSIDKLEEWLAIAALLPGDGIRVGWGVITRLE